LLACHHTFHPIGPLRRRAFQKERNMSYRTISRLVLTTAALVMAWLLAGASTAEARPAPEPVEPAPLCPTVPALAVVSDTTNWTTYALVAALAALATGLAVVAVRAIVRRDAASHAIA
jgi:hypothetical protein